MRYVRLRKMAKLDLAGCWMLIRCRSLALGHSWAYTLLIVSKGDKETAMSDINININIKKFPKAVADKLRYYVYPPTRSWFTFPFFQFPAPS